MNSWKCQKRRVNRVSLEGFVSSVSRGGGMYLPMQLSPDFWYGQPKRLASGETTAASFAVRRALIEVQLPLRPQLSRTVPLDSPHLSRHHATNLGLPRARLPEAESGRIQAPLQLW
ncbi:hypothetical protein IG631_21642 [Alternaria alternata]|jgi:hypothetical protein|nr:hypothetical protein IG631_21642 [Alternaria alternata]